MSDIASHTERELAILTDVAQQMSRTFELVPLLRVIEQACRAALECQRATIFLYDEASDELHSTVATGVEGLRFSARQGIAGEALHTKKIIVVQDAYADPRFNQAIDKQTGYRTHNILTLPLIVPDGQAIGVLQLLNKDEGPWDASDRVLGQALGSLTGIAIKRQMLLDEAAEKHRMERDLSIARQIQLNLFPKNIPEAPGYDLAGWNRSAELTGGDCYDFYPLDERRIAVMVADATGHGIGPALIVAQCRTLLRILMEDYQSLGEVARRVNQRLYEDLDPGHFVTACFGILDTHTHRFHYLSAGHGPLMLYRKANHDVEEFSADTLPFGIMDDENMPPASSLELQPGDAFVLLTDGFSEWANEQGDRYGDERLIETIKRHHNERCHAMIDQIYRDVLRFAGQTTQADDLTAVIFKRLR